MQKQVSKQSLAIIALSILLAISMALTATFAVFTNTQTATGTIQFSGITAITATSTDAEKASVETAGSLATSSAIAFTLKGVQDLTSLQAAFGAVKLTPATGSPDCFIKVTFAPYSGNNTSVISPAYATTATTNFNKLTGTNVYSSKAKVTSTGVTLAELIADTTTVNLANISSADEQPTTTIVITLDSSLVDFNAA